ncbi:MAG: GMP synthase [Albidovulum sp.]|uniref:type 1 glutamine amidotransferase n=1 Tax=Albidovulum sp. TaxID=1872424 RepID=UPI001320825F|nr:type 1 glutamine amidotransferase [Defluviimonas sp.]KAB2883310.1 MAG: GMP synthase [Defluviimonas sp.]
MRVLVVYNFEGCRLGQIGTALSEADARIDLVRAHLGEPLPKGPEGHDAIVVLGGVQNALADDTSPWLPRLLDVMRGFAESGRSLLGVCLGSQLLARAYGGANIIGGASEFGWQRVDLTPEGVDDPLFTGTAPSFPIFQWHDDTFEMPSAATRLATGHSVENQAFVIGRAAYGIQFHFEADRPLVAEWNGEYADLLARLQPGWAKRHPAEADRFGPASDAVGLAIARNWVRTIGKS